MSPSPEVVLRPMTREEYGPYLDALIEEYAASHVTGGRWTAQEAPREARLEVEHLLPQGPETLGHRLFTVHAGTKGPMVGFLWVAKRPGEAFVYDLKIVESHRREGYGRATMLAAEGVARELGCPRISLHVFGSNTAARTLYLALGYRETNVVMAKDLA